jgi:hypothetical protein
MSVRDNSAWRTLGDAQALAFEVCGLLVDVGRRHSKGSIILELRSTVGS